MAADHTLWLSLRTLISLLLLGLAVLLAWRLPLAALPAALAYPLAAVLTHIALMRWALVWLELRSPPLEHAWYTVRRWEAPLYRRLGVVGYRNLLRRVGWERFRRDALGFGGTRSSLGTYERATRRAEYSHLPLAAVGFGAVLMALGLRSWTAASWLLATNLFFQVYPVLLQRLLRGRVQTLRRSPL